MRISSSLLFGIARSSTCTQEENMKREYRKYLNRLIINNISIFEYLIGVL